MNPIVKKPFPARLRALIFDLDGTLADTEGLYRRFWLEAARAFGYPMEERHALAIRAMAPEHAKALLRREVDPAFDYDGVRAYRRRIMAEWMRTHPVREKAGASELLREARRRGLRLAVATATPKERALGELASAGLPQDFDFMACGGMVERGKPAPDLFLLALSGLGVPAEEAVGVEDSPSGIRAVRAAGLYAVLVPDQDEPDAETVSYADAVLPSLRALRTMLFPDGEARG